MLNRPNNQHLLHLLYQKQQSDRHISNGAITEIAEQLSLPHSQIESVVEFYSFFTRNRRGEYDLLFSNCPCCGNLKLMHALCERLGVSEDETSSNGSVSIGQTSCIGMCDHGASMLVNGLTLTSLDETLIEEIAERIEQRTPISEWPQKWFGIGNQIRKEGLLLSTPFESGSALARLSEMDAATIIDEINASGLKGRGGAGFGTGAKWQFCHDAPGETRYVICNADEGEPGTFKDRVLLTSHADAVFEGMTVCARAIGAARGFLYLRGEYRYMLSALETTLQKRRECGLLGSNILGQGFDFDIDIVVGAGAYVCGEESALIESIEEKPGIPRIRPPFPVTHGLFGCPTVVNNVETLAAAARIIANGHHWFETSGTWQSRGSKLISISGDCARPGIYEYPFGITISEILADCGASDTQAIQIGGPAGTLISPAKFGHRIAFEDIATGGSFMIFDQSRDLLAIIHDFSRFFAHESCSFCTPCRVGTRLLRNGMQKLVQGHATAHDLDELKQTAAVVSKRSHCGLGATAANPIRDGLERFPELFDARLLHQEMEPEFDLDAALSEARDITHRDDSEAHL